MIKSNELGTEPMLSLFHHRWSLPVITELGLMEGAKFITLVNKLKVSRDSLNRTLKALAEYQWVTKNPGYGHPMRPEYILTADGARIAPICNALITELEELDISQVALNKWSLPLMTEICQGGNRFSDLKKRFDQITPRALTQALKLLTSHNVIERSVDADQYPPRVEYELASHCQNLCLILEQLVESLNTNS